MIRPINRNKETCHLSKEMMIANKFKFIVRF